MAASVSDLVLQLHSNIDSIHSTIRGFSDTKQHDDAMSQAEKEREERIASLRQKHEEDARIVAEQRKKHEEDLAAQRQKEEEEIMEQRRREDEERKAKIEQEEQDRLAQKKQEDEAREREREEKEKSEHDRVEAELERLETEMEARVEEGKKMLEELDEKRKVCLLFDFMLFLSGLLLVELAKQALIRLGVLGNQRSDRRRITQAIRPPFSALSQPRKEKYSWSYSGARKRTRKKGGAARAKLESDCR